MHSFENGNSPLKLIQLNISVFIKMHDVFIEAGGCHLVPLPSSRVCLLGLQTGRDQMQRALSRLMSGPSASSRTSEPTEHGNVIDRYGRGRRQEYRNQKLGEERGRGQEYRNQELGVERGRGKEYRNQELGEEMGRGEGQRTGIQESGIGRGEGERRGVEDRNTGIRNWEQRGVETGIQES